ncbi:hypothetical protein BCU68_01345 [Vibrio sp. 10N.286.49.B3]|uniref:hypothetical protein n=1 Tax=Vibrio sp. 10N.286.49.B3 TaxID=1880855 RepID=UPI000C83FA48|nr:hypothetical protein [Vibrio sp. 10N.286.49.B3]PMH46708.1 hypothetical protein BCU68_01345 [Vibrio sp. 10N.286.49.B3]
MIKQWSGIGVLFLLLSGCAEHIGERQGTQMDVIPVHYSMAVKVKPKQSKAAQKEVDQFINDHWNVIVNQTVELNWRTKEGQKWATKIEQDLLKRGVNRDNLSVSQVSAGFGERFDFEVKATVHKVMASVCDYAQVGHFGEPNNGCYTDNARWGSMVNPEKMLNHYLDADNVNK